MTVYFDKEQLSGILRDFYTVTGITISVFDADFKQIIYYPNPMPELCRLIKGHKKGRSNCQCSDMAACRKSAQMGTAYTFTCHAGLVDTAAPVIYNGRTIAYMMFGQITDIENEYSSLEETKKRCLEYGIDPCITEQLYSRLNRLSHKQIASAANLLNILTVFVHISHIVKEESNVLAKDIEAFVKDKMDARLSVNELCGEFGVSKNTLYTIFRRYFGKTVEQYIRDIKTEEAKRLLTTTNIPVSMVSERLGFADYNYFIRLFKKQTSYTPLKYRAKFPHDIL